MPIEDGSEFKTEQPTRTGRIRRSRGNSADFGRQTEGLLADSDDFAYLNADGECKSSIVLPVEGPVVVTHSHEPTFLQIERKGWSDNHVIRVRAIRRASVRNRILNNRACSQIFYAGVNQGKGWASLILAGTELVRGCRGENQCRSDPPPAPRLFKGEEIEKLQISYADYTELLRWAATRD